MSASQQPAQLAKTNQPPDRLPLPREALEQSEKRAAEGQPGTFDERNLDDKIVEIPPKEETSKPIRGLDPEGNH